MSSTRIRQDVLSECAVYVRWYFTLDFGRRNDGLHVANAGACDESAVRGHDAKSQPT